MEVELLFNPRDLRVGFHWTEKSNWKGCYLLLYFCLIPCFHLKVTMHSKCEIPFEVCMERKLSKLQQIALDVIAVFCHGVKGDCNCNDGTTTTRCTVFSFPNETIAEHFYFLITAFGIAASQPEEEAPF